MLQIILRLVILRNIEVIDLIQILVTNSNGTSVTWDASQVGYVSGQFTPR